MPGQGDFHEAMPSGIAVAGRVEDGSPGQRPGLQGDGQRWFLRRPGELVEVAERMVPWERVLTPTVGGLLAGLVL